MTILLYGVANFNESIHEIYCVLGIKISYLWNVLFNFWSIDEK